MEGKSPQLNYYINRRQYNMGYYLAGDPKWATLVQAIANHVDAPKGGLLYTKMHTEKMLRAFGILQAR